MEPNLDDAPRSHDPDAHDIARVIDREQVRSVFQPIIDLDSGAVVGYEALARGPVGPLERPDQLFAAARAAGRLADLDELCRRAAILGAIDAGVCAPLALFVNVEPEVLDVAPLQQLLDIADSAPGDLQLVLEITERALASRPAELLATVARLRAAGCRIALDDVGADDLSLAFMPVLRPDIVKLDLQLVQRRPGPKVAEIMNAVNAYAERTGSVILAEGVEDPDHLAVARALGARLGQGWMFGRPAASPVPGLAIGALKLSALSMHRRVAVRVPSAHCRATPLDETAAHRGQQVPGARSRAAGSYLHRAVHLPATASLHSEYRSPLRQPRLAGGLCRGDRSRTTGGTRDRRARRGPGDRRPGTQRMGRRDPGPPLRRRVAGTRPRDHRT